MREARQRGLTATKALLAVAVCALASVVPAAVALAGDSSVQVEGGSLGITAGGAVGNFTPVTLTGSNVSTTAQISDIVVTDARGSGAGWRLQLTGTNLIGSGSAAGKTISASQVTVKRLADVTPGPGVTAPNPQLNGAPTFALPTSAANLATAAEGAGMGTYTLDCADDMLTLVVPASTYAGTYTTTITIDTVSGPGL